MVRGCLEALLWHKEREMEGVEKGRSSFGEVVMELQEGKALLQDAFKLNSGTTAVLTATQDQCIQSHSLRRRVLACLRHIPKNAQR